MPHVWLVDRNGNRVSATLDLTGKGRFTVVTGLAGQSWAAAVAAMSWQYLTYWIAPGGMPAGPP